MCYHTKQTKTAKQLEQRFKATFKEGESFQPAVYNAFDFKSTPIITNKDTDLIEMYYWGLVPHWANEKAIRKNTLNAKIETIHEKPSFKNVAQNRCLILIDGFYEWQWLDEKGKQKQKYEMTLPNEEAFALAGLFNIWTEKQTGEVIKTYTILTTEANEQMAAIHNSKKRMPIVVSSSLEGDWFEKGKVPVETVHFNTKKLHQNIQTKLPF